MPVYPGAFGPTPNRLPCGPDQIVMIGQAQVVIGAQVDDFFAIVHLNYRTLG
jgi:hypothetical protein